MVSTTGKSTPRTARREVGYTKDFAKDLKKAKSHIKCDLVALKAVMEKIENREKLDAKYLDHFLTGRYPDQKRGKTDCRECHVCNYWLLIYRFPDDNSVHFIRTGTHSELFKAK